MSVSINSFILPNKPFKWIRFLGVRYVDYDPKLLFEYMEKDGDRGFFFTDIPNRNDNDKVRWRCDSFKSGYMLVRMLSGAFAYIREGDGVLLPYRFAFASEFNESGYAMVGTCKGVSWINTKFEFVATNGKKYNCDPGYNNPFGRTNIRAFNGITSLEGEKRKISVLFTGRDSSIMYFDSINGIMNFVRFDGKEHKEQKIKKIIITIDDIRSSKLDLEQFVFNDQGYVVLGDKAIFANGHFCTTEDLAKLSFKVIDEFNSKDKKFVMQPVDEKNKF